MNYHITNMTKLCIYIISNLLVYQLITKLLWNIFCNHTFVFGLKYDIYYSIITFISLLMDIE